tara:strand:- start:776 stop:1600 length:825 start_codon:yes stop_codon:yes gene_type:complete
MDYNNQYNNIPYNNNNITYNNQQDNYNIINNYINFLNQYMNTVNSGIDFIRTSNMNLRIMQRNLDYYITNYLHNHSHNHNHNHEYEYNNLEQNNNNNNDYDYNQIEYNYQNYQYNNQENPDQENYVNQMNENQIITNINNYRQLSNQNLSEILNNNITIKKYSDIENPLNDSCAITHDTFNQDDHVACLNHCKHIFKYDPLVNWLNQHQTCPICRDNILTGTNIVKYTNSNDETMFLTRNQFRHFLANNIAYNIINNNNMEDTSNNSFIFSIIR